MEFAYIMPHVVLLGTLICLLVLLGGLFFSFGIAAKAEHRTAKTKVREAEAAIQWPERRYTEDGSVDPQWYTADERFRKEVSPLKDEEYKLRTKADHRWAWGCTVGIPSLILILIFAAVLVPYDSKYRSFYTLTGTVSSIQNVFTSEDDMLMTEAVVTVDGFEKPFTVDDPRILTLQGREATFRCDWEWVPGGADRLGCLIQSY